MLFPSRSMRALKALPGAPNPQVRQTPPSEHGDGAQRGVQSTPYCARRPDGGQINKEARHPLSENPVVGAGAAVQSEQLQEDLGVLEFAPSAYMKRTLR